MLIPAGALPLRTSGRRILGGPQGLEIQFACVNWYGSHMEAMVPTGLEKRPLAVLAQTIVDMKFNCVRLPYSLEMLSASATVPDAKMSLAANPQLLGKSPLEIFDATVEALSDVGLVTILNDHVSKAGWCCSKTDGEGLWYTETYSEEMWMESLVQLSTRYRNNPRVVGFDIRNEVRHSPLGVPTWGSGPPGTDWARAAKDAGLRIKAVNPDMLVIVSGLDFSMYLCDVPQRPLHLEGALAGHVVYTTHEYDWYYSDSGVFRQVARNSVPWYLKILLFFFTVVLVRALVTTVRSRWRAYRLGNRYNLWSKQSLWFDLTKLLDPLATWRRAFAAGVSIALLDLIVVLIDHLASRCMQHDNFTAWILLITAPTELLSLLLCTWWLWPTLVTNLDSTRGVPVHSTDPNVFGDVETADKSPEADFQAMGPSQLEAPMRLPTASPPARAIGSSSSTGGAASHFEISSEDRHHEKTRRSTWQQLPLRWALLLLMLAASVFHLTSWSRYLDTYEALEEELDGRWGFLLREGAPAERAAPIWLSEFGTGEDTRWWKHIIRYIHEHELGFAYWPWNGQKRLGEDETFGILKGDYLTVRHDWKLQDLQSLIKPS